MEKKAHTFADRCARVTSVKHDGKPFLAYFNETNKSAKITGSPSGRIYDRGPDEKCSNFKWGRRPRDTSSLYIV